MIAAMLEEYKGVVDNAGKIFEKVLKVDDSTAN